MALSLSNPKLFVLHFSLLTSYSQSSSHFTSLCLTPSTVQKTCLTGRAGGRQTSIAFPDEKEFIFKLAQGQKETQSGWSSLPKVIVPWLEIETNISWKNSVVQLIKKFCHNKCFCFQVKFPFVAIEILPASGKLRRYKKLLVFYLSVVLWGGNEGRWEF